MSIYKTILLVDDDDDDRSFFTDAVAELDNSIVIMEARNGALACEYLQSGKPLPDLIVLDLNMPMMNGQEFLRLVKTEPFYAPYKHIPVAVLTTAIEYKEQCYRLGAHLYMVNPTSVKLLGSMICTLLSHDIIKDAALIRDLIEH
jgi:CheY-like chemotaxis protein